MPPTTATSHAGDSAERGLGEPTARVGVDHQRARDDRLHAVEPGEIVGVGFVDDDRVDQSRVTRCDVARSRSAGEPGEHPVGRALHRAASDQRADGDARHAAALERFADRRRRRGSARSTRTGCSARSAARRPRRSPRRTPGAGAAASAPSKRTPSTSSRCPRATNHSWNGNEPAACRSTCAAARRSRAAAAPRRRTRRASRAVTVESGSPARRAAVRTRWMPEVAVAEREPRLSAERR